MGFRAIESIVCTGGKRQLDRAFAECLMDKRGGDSIEKTDQLVLALVRNTKSRKLSAEFLHFLCR
ncbi:hypothetical protein [Novosphingobium chloroacetimidivorans]|uniref:hypothetical protein n=1 Tax=Novosphingobium chloroacetimidivorans TaxID=1428314 RepID=UPI0016118B1D|nr:hypothetical protein [Novosphingobium chloroacetimidivorans]